MWKGRASPSTDVAETNSALVQMWKGLSAVRVQVESLTDIEVATRLLQTTQVRRTNSTL